MTFEEYISQAYPKPNPMVVLNKSEYIIKDTIKVNENTSFTLIYIPKIAERFGTDGCYIQKNNSSRLHVAYPVKGASLSSGSVFYLQPKKNEIQDIIGVYAVRSPYHEEEFYLPFVILSRRTFGRSYAVDTVEYKGATAYKIESDYSEQTIHELLDNGTIVKWGDHSEMTSGGKITELMQVFWNAKESDE